ncbi:MAG: thiamine pyrophosphate-requiring protein [Candidatus Bathyarchaeia archaeon]
MKGSTAIANILKLEGVEFVSAYPSGGASVPLINACAEAGIRTILARQERVVVNIADGYTRVSGRNGVAIVSGGVGSENAFSGVSQAFADLVPVLVLAGQDARRRAGARAIQDFDLLHSYCKITKWVESINLAERAPELMRRAFTYLRTGRPSPVVLGVPDDVPDEEFDDAKFVYKPIKGWRTGGDPRDVEVAVRALLSAKAPLIYAGEGVFHAQAWDELRGFAELVQAPVMTTMKGKSAFPENHPLSVGSGGGTGPKTGAHFLQRADLVFCIGASLTKGPGAPIPAGKVIVQMNGDERDVNKDYLADLVVIGDAKVVLRQLVDEVERQTGGRGRRDEGVVDEIRRVKDEWMEEWMPKLTSDEVPINPYRVYWDLMHTIDREKTIVTHDAGLTRDQFCPVYEAIIPRGYIGWGHHSTLGYSIGGSIGAKLAAPDKTVINVMGDGAFGMTGLDFETAVRNRVPILTILINNSGLGVFFRLTPSTAALGGNYAKIAEGMGGYSERIEKPDEIIPAIKRAERSLRSGRPALLEFITKIEPATMRKYWSF